MSVTRCTTDMNTLIRYLEGDLSPRLVQTTKAHVADGCDFCDQRIAWLESLVDPEDPNITSRVVAIPIPDPRLSSIPVAQRGALASVNQHLFQARSDIRVDVQTEKMESGDFVLEGQIMLFGGGGRSARGAKTSLYINGKLISEIHANEIGEFEFVGLAAGSYDLAIELEQTCVVVPELEL